MSNQRLSKSMQRCMALVLLGALATSGCGTICFPERSLNPLSERGGVDVAIFVADIIFSAPTILIGLFGMAVSGAAGPDCWKLLFLALWIDTKQGTLWHPKEGPAPDNNP